MQCLYAKLAYNVDKSLFPSHAISLSFPKLMYMPFFYVLYDDENCQTLSLLVQTILLSWVPIFPIYMKARFLGAPYHNLHSLSLSHTHLTQLEDGSKESGQHHHPIWRAKSEGKNVQQRTSPASQEGKYQAPDFLMLDPQVNEDYSWKRLIFQKHSSRS